MSVAVAKLVGTAIGALTGAGATAVIAQADPTSGIGVPILSLGAVLTLCTAAVGYGVVKGKTDANSEAINNMRDSTSQAIEGLRKENADSHRDTRDEMRKRFDALDRRLDRNRDDT